MDKAERDMMRAELVEEIKQHPVGEASLAAATALVQNARERALTDEQLAQDFGLFLFQNFLMSQTAVQFATGLGEMIGQLRGVVEMRQATRAASDPAGRQN